MAALSGHYGSDLLSVLINIGCNGGSIETKAFPSVVFTENQS